MRLLVLENVAPLSPFCFPFVAALFLTAEKLAAQLTCAHVHNYYRTCSTLDTQQFGWRIKELVDEHQVVVQLAYTTHKHGPYMHHVPLVQQQRNMMLLHHHRKVCLASPTYRSTYLSFYALPHMHAGLNSPPAIPLLQQQQEAESLGRLAQEMEQRRMEDCNIFSGMQQRRTKLCIYYLSHLCCNIAATHSMS